MRLHDPTRAVAYAAMLPAITAVARQFGYACAVHGSMATDLDIVLVPWVEDSASPADVVEAIRLLVGGRKRSCDILPTEKPLGRLAWSFYFEADNESNKYGGVGPYIDISVTPRGKHTKKK